jgi:hypothetical protein
VTEQQDRIKLLRKEEKRKRVIPQLLAALNGISGTQISESDILTTDQIDEHQIEINSTDFTFNFLTLSFPAAQPDELARVLEVLKDPLSQQNYFSMSGSSELAVFRVDTGFVLTRFEQLMQLENENIMIQDLNYRNGLWLDRFEEYWYLNGKADKVPVYQLTVFGKDWIKAVSGNW